MQSVIIVQQVSQQNTDLALQSCTTSLTQLHQQLQPFQLYKDTLRLQVLTSNRCRHCSQHVFLQNHRLLFLQQLNDLQRSRLDRLVLDRSVVLIGSTIDLQSQLSTTLKLAVEDDFEDGNVAFHLVESGSLI